MPNSASSRLHYSKRNWVRGDQLKKLIIILIAVSTILSISSPASAVEANSQPGGLAISEDNLGVIVDSNYSKPIKISVADAATSNWEHDENGPQATAPSVVFQVEQFSPGSAQVNVQILDKSAQEKFRFSFRQDEKLLKPKLNDFGAIDLLDLDGNFVAFILTPWAKDATGQSVATHFEVDGSVLVQVVDHLSSRYEYPIAADPYLGIDLISSVSAKLDSAGSFYDLKIDVTPWTGSLYLMYPTLFSAFNRTYALTGGAYAVYLVQNYGWNEVLSKLEVKYSSQFRGYIYSRPTYKNQFDCHALGAPVVFASTIAGFDGSPTWDLEGRRGSTTDLTTWVAKMCNW